ncbi:MAG: ATP-binding protein [Pseudomonadota bacterium]
MDPRFTPHNQHHIAPERFDELDPNLARLRRHPLVHRSNLLDRLPQRDPGICTLGGGRQVGKTTLVKQWMSALIRGGTPPLSVQFVTGELIDDHHGLVRLFQEWRDTLADIDSFGYFLVDEVTYIRDWDRGMKFLADAGLLASTAVLLTGSDLAMIREARMRLPGRRGDADVVDFHLHPLDFRDVIRLKGALSNEDLEAAVRADPDLPVTIVDRLFEEFRSYLIHGGYLTAINDIAETGRIRTATLRTYSDWIRGDMLKRGKREHSIREVLGAIIKRYGSQVTWNALSRDLSIDHPATIADYVSLLEQMDAVFVRYALREDRLGPAPKKARKLDFADPFILHAVRTWLESPLDPWENIMSAVAEPSSVSHIVEAVVANHLSRRYPTYYIKAEGEVDVAYVHRERFHPIEVKWTRQRRPTDAKQIAKYPNGVIWDRGRRPGELHGVPTIPLPLALLRLEPMG